MKISGHQDGRIFARYNIADAGDFREAKRKVSQYEQEECLARAKQLNVHTLFREPEEPALPFPVL